MKILLTVIIVLVATFPIVGRSFYKKENWAGIALSFALGVPAWFLGTKIPLAGGPVFGILLGILLSAVVPKVCKPGVKVTAKKVLQAAVVLFGFELNIRNVLEVGGRSVVLLLVTLTVAFLTAFLVSKALKVEPTVATLVGVGTAICGGSAIAAAAPAIRAKDEDVATAISTIFLFNIMAVFIFPAIGHALAMSDVRFGVWAGTAINDTSSVVAASFSYSDAAGQLATIVKLTRTLMIVPITFALALYTAKKCKGEDASFSLKKVFPWFVLGFVATCIIASLGFVDPALAKSLGRSGKFLITVAMVAIGLGTNVKALITNGKKPIALGLCCWFAVAAASLIAQNLLGLV